MSGDADSLVYSVAVYWGSRRSLRMALREVVARNLRRLRRSKALSQEELADRAGINRNYVGMLEREENAATVDMLEKLANVLEVDPIEFFKRPVRADGRKR